MLWVFTAHPVVTPRGPGEAGFESLDFDRPAGREFDSEFVPDQHRHTDQGLVPDGQRSDWPWRTVPIDINEVDAELFLGTVGE